MGLITQIFLKISLLVVALISCNRTDLQSSEKNTAGTARLCIAGGATLDPTANICVCPQGMSWGGQHCEAATREASLTGSGVSTSSTLGESIEPVKADTATKIDEAKPMAGLEGAQEELPSSEELKEIVKDNLGKSKSTSGSVNSDWQQTLRQRCNAAKADWIASDRYCHCGQAQVLVGNKCRTLRGSITDDACQRSVIPGKWLAGQCTCKGGKVFSPFRGGCVKPIRGNEALFRRSCESSLNLGQWNAFDKKCSCPNGNVWIGELCTPQHKLSSKIICESSENNGAWDSTQKKCLCGAGMMWVNLKCTIFNLVTPSDGCRSGGSGGTWSDTTGTCLCPADKKWTPEDKSCQ